MTSTPTRRWLRLSLRRRDPMAAARGALRASTHGDPMSTTVTPDFLARAADQLGWNDTPAGKQKRLEDLALLQRIDPHHRGQGIRRADPILACLWLVGLDQSDQRLPEHDSLHLRAKLLPLGVLQAGGQLIVRETEPLASQQSYSGLLSRVHSPWIDCVAQNSLAQ